MDIADIATTDAVEVDVDDRLGKVRAIFESQNPKAVIATEDGEYVGVLTQRQLLRSHVEDETKVAAMYQAAPSVDRRDDIRDVARMLVEGGTKVAPVYEGERLDGMITADDILETVLDSLDALTVGDIQSEDVVTVREDDDVGRVINLLREHGISRLPVVNENGSLIGVVTIQDVVDFVTRHEQRATTGDRSGDSDRMLDLPVYDLMSSPVETTTPDTRVDEAVGLMLEQDFAGLIVTPPGDDGQIVGVVTKTDVLRALSIREEEHLDVQITNVKLLDTLSRQTIRERIESVADKYADMQVQHAHVRLHKHKEKLRGTPLIQCKIRLRTDHGQIAGSGEGYGADHAFHVALDKLERNVIELKGLNHDEEYKGQLLRKLGEL
ncbi:MAG: CBS domain-containing protein [Halobacteriales archaeon]|nr:CBS domain-containing protein [Halobacteriales archaeon]